MREIKIKVYKFDELSEEAKEKARMWYRESRVDDMQFEWGHYKDDAKNIGIELREWEYRRYLKCSLELDFSQVLANILKDHGECCETWKTAKRYKDEYDKLTEEQVLNNEDEELREEFTRDIAEDYRVLLDNQYDYLNTDEYVDEMLTINEYEFKENGKIL
jgi:hypothetical protein